MERKSSVHLIFVALRYATEGSIIFAFFKYKKNQKMEDI